MRQNKRPKIEIHSNPNRHSFLTWPPNNERREWERMFHWKCYENKTKQQKNEHEKKIAWNVRETIKTCNHFMFRSNQLEIEVGYFFFLFLSHTCYNINQSVILRYGWSYEMNFIFLGGFFFLRCDNFRRQQFADLI